MNTKLKLKELEERVERLTDKLNTAIDNLDLLMNFMDKDTVVVKFDPSTYSNLYVTVSANNYYPVYHVYYFLGNDIKCTNIRSLYSFGSNNWNKQVPYKITRLDDKVIIIEFNYSENLGTKTYLIDRVKGTLTDITL